MNVKDRLYAGVLPPLLYTIVAILFNTLKIRSINEEKIKELNRRGKRIVYAFWHGQSFFLIKYMARRNITIIASPSRDGKLGADVLKRFGYGIIYGSSSKSPIRAIIQSVQAMRAGRDMAIAVDGPRGPLHQIKPGALFLAKKMNASIVPAVNSSFPALTFRSWDRFILPRPFARSVMVFGDPVLLSPDMSDETMQNETRMIEAELNRLTRLADRMTGYKDKDLKI
jgi:lysophospholipid acyltransferase (LPLAT)-like uncharacterized protein